MIMNADSLEHFRTIPQCAEIINRPGVKVGLSKSSKATSHLNPLFNETVTHNDGLRKQLYLFRDEVDSQGAPDREGYLLLELGDGVAGQASIAHGGFLSVIMDQVTGTLIGLTGADGGLGMYTVALNVSYHKPVFVPAVVIAKAKISRIERRRIHVDASIVDMQGDTCTTAEAIFVQKRPEAL